MEKMVPSAKNKVIFVCGKTRSGKSFVSQKLAQAMNYKFVEVSSIVKSILETDKRSEIVNKPELDIAIANHLKALAEQDNLLISGVRQLTILKQFPDAQIIWLHTPDRIRREWFDRDLEIRKDDLELSQIDEMDKELQLSSILEYIFNKDK